MDRSLVMYCRSISSQISEPARATLTTSHTAGVLDYVAVSPTTFNTGLLLVRGAVELPISCFPHHFVI